mgnify:CR=1 FL=1
MSSPLAEAFLMDSLNSCYETPSKLRFIVIATRSNSESHHYDG